MSDTPKRDRLAEIQARLDAATPGPWEWFRRGDELGYRRPDRTIERVIGLRFNNDGDAEPDIPAQNEALIISAPADLAFLLAIVREAAGVPCTCRPAGLRGLYETRCAACLVRIRIGGAA
jgi:hypothetical protein